jgi:hypothetical protein
MLIAPVCSPVTVNAGPLQEKMRIYSGTFKEEYQEISMDQLGKWYTEMEV